ncbi:hypothetical protein BL250_09205 [Erwinia sp. OLTSP20]|uniref:fimbrial biogenesis chaperone n=1 Tax=unclassified Erwinia TaxID=2622719 RepID=UPI000C19778F|nr:MULTISPECIES: molecular chaperone [unclassified Erwinia]PIJ50708.1 hypothetical protein BV501_06880 [Erwinia sp. OAMSP11]PIJ75378.1 hypothetical protein BK416_01680 [Erwinia sp. OLSSP12]PIJ81876.1 hypothetical protein BLD47_07230 [Erwinia sp. OLCASP19]PIJ84531.1 hypothetical protein BLD46_07320 [Erwinia sp. OLMTSP26]PIJ86878.1 hypothetical protein BLD49_07090 [Erwinia sp. OLMDSP33]
MGKAFIRKYVRRVVVALAVLPGLASADGVGIDATRVIFPAQEKSVVTAVRNTETRAVYLMQVAVTATPSGGDAPFVATPPLFRSEPGTHNQVRIVRTPGAALAKDRESLYWFTLKAIPQVTDQVRQSAPLKGSTQIGLGTAIKLIYRPQGLPVTPEKGFGMLRFTRAAGGIKISNLSPYYVSFASLRVGGVQLLNNRQMVNMVAPYSDTVMKQAGLVFPAKVSWSAINDLGGELKYNGEAI